jgi:hypothetical protein
VFTELTAETETEWTPGEKLREAVNKKVSDVESSNSDTDRGTYM